MSMLGPITNRTVYTWVKNFKDLSPFFRVLLGILIVLVVVIVLAGIINKPN